MTGKVFNESANIYQDQAKVLFDYYKSAAEKIVSAEMNEEQNRADLEAGKAAEQKKFNLAKILMPVLMGLGVAIIIVSIFTIWPLAILGLGSIGVGVKFLIDFLKSRKEIEEYDKQILLSDERYRDIRRDYRIDKIGVVYVPVATRVPFEDKSFLLDHTGEVGDTGFNLSVLRKPEEFQESVQELSDLLESIPVVEDNKETEEINTADYSTSIQNVTLNDYVGNVDRQMRNISYLLDESDDVSVSIPVIMPESESADFIKEYSTDNTGAYPVVDVFPVDFEEKLRKFESLGSLKNQLGDADETDSNELMKRLMVQMADSVQMFTKVKNLSSSKLMQYYSSIFGLVLKAAYTQYSPSMEAEEIERIRLTDFDYRTAVNDYSPFNLNEASRVKYDMFSGNWVAEDGSRTTMPFGMHQIDEEIFMPVIASLMQENRIERLKIYNSIEDQKRTYLERWTSETGNYFRDNRKTADELITHMRETYADYMSAYTMYQSLKGTTEAMKGSRNLEDSEVKEIDEQAEMIAGFEAQAAQCNQQQELFADFMDRIQENISDTTSEFSHIKYYDGELRDTLPHEVAVAMSNLYELDDRRKTLAVISPFVAKNAELPPEPMTSLEMAEDVAIDLTEQVKEKLEQINVKADVANRQ